MPSTPRKPRPSSKTIQLYVTSSGPLKGDAECRAAFQSKDDAVQFLADLHGLKVEETKKLKREFSLRLKKRLHGSEKCFIQLEEMPAKKAKQALSGELYLGVADNVRTPRKLRAEKKVYKTKPVARSSRSARA